jgi:phytoene dehydrogenase-like protein
MFSPLVDDYILFSDDVRKTQQQFGRFNLHDAEIYPEFNRYIGEAADVVRKLLFDVPPDPSKTDFRSLKELASFEWKYRNIGARFYRLIDLMTMSAEDLLRKWFDDSRIRAVLAYYASIGTFVSPKTPGSAYVIIHHIMGDEGAGGWGFIRGGMGAITQAIASYGRTRGLDLEVNADVERILVENGRAVGVALRNGREYRVKVIASSAAAPVHLPQTHRRKGAPPEFVRDIRNYRTRSSAFKMNVACKGLPQYRGLGKALAHGALGSFSYPTYVHIAPDIEYLDRSYADAKDGWYSTEPFLTAVTPTVVDNTLAPPGGFLRRYHRHGRADPGRDRAARQPALGPHLPWRAGARPTVLQAAGAALRQLPLSAAGALSVRIERASRWRRVGHSGPQRGAGNPEGSRKEDALTDRCIDEDEDIHERKNGRTGSWKLGKTSCKQRWPAQANLRPFCILHSALPEETGAKRLRASEGLRSLIKANPATDGRGSQVQMVAGTGSDRNLENSQVKRDAEAGNRQNLRQQSHYDFDPTKLAALAARMAIVADASNRLKELFQAMA